MDETEQRRCRLNLAIIEIGKLVFECKIRTELHTQDLKVFLNHPSNKQQIERLKVDHVLTQEQFDLLYDRSPDVPKLEQLDIALLIVLIRTFFCSVPRDDRIWNKGYKPDLNDTSLEADIVRLRNVKNDIQKEGEEHYDQQWEAIYEILLRIGSDIPDLQNILDRIKDTSRDISLEEKDNVDKNLFQWSKMEKAFESGFDLSPSDATVMQMKLNSLIVDGGRRVFKSLLDDRIPPNCLQRVINNNRALINSLHRPPRQIINDSQYDILFPSVGSPTSNDFDISLFAIFFRNFCGLRPCNDAIWDARNAPSPTNVSKEADIVRIRNYRNEISHMSKTSSITQDVFEVKWQVITEVLLRLKGTGLDDQHMQEEIDNFKVQPLDPEKANILEKELETWINADEKMQHDIIKQIQKHSLYEAARVRSKVAVGNVIPDEMFVKTRQYEEAKKILTENGIVILAGPPGEGKSTLAKKLLKEMSKDDSEKFLKLDMHSDWVNVLDEITVVFIDDMFGKGVFDKAESRKWQKLIPTMSDLLKMKKIQIIITSRSYILEEVKHKLYVDQLFTARDIYTLSSQNLKREEKREILVNHFRFNKRNDDELIEEILDVDIGECDTSFTIGFPECVRLFSSNDKLFMKKIEFFQRPMNHVKQCISDLLADDDIFVAFFVLWAQSTQCLLSSTIELPVNGTQLSILDPILRLQFPAEKYLRKVRYVLLTHKDGFIRYDRENELFEFSHLVVRDAVGIASYERNPTAVLQYCDVEFIKNCIRTETDSDERIALSPARYKQISRRIAKLALPDVCLNDGSVGKYLKPAVFQSRLFDDERFCSVLLETLNNDIELKDILTSPVRTVMSEFTEYRFLESKVSNVEILMPSFMIMNTDHISPFCEKWLAILSSNKSPCFIKELEISMLFAVKSGNYTVIESLINKGAECNNDVIAIALIRDDKEMLDFLCMHKTVKVQERPLLHEFCKLGYVEAVEKLLQQGADVRQPDSLGRLPINEAATYRHFNVVKILLEHDRKLADLEIFKCGKEPAVDLLHFSVISGDKMITDYLIQSGFPTSSVDRFGRTSFLLAIALGKYETATSLVESAIRDGVQCTPDNDKNSPLLLTIKRVVETSVKSSDDRKLSGRNLPSWKDILDRLCTFKENIHLKNTKGEMAIEVACQNGLEDVVNKILTHGTTLTGTDGQIFHYFVKKGDEKCIQTLLRSDIDPNRFDNDHRTPFMLANSMGKTTISQLLMSDSRIRTFNRKLGIAVLE